MWLAREGDALTYLRCVQRGLGAAGRGIFLEVFAKLFISISIFVKKEQQISTCSFGEHVGVFPYKILVVGCLE